jgi:type IV pilus assembly protein PilA
MGGITMKKNQKGFTLIELLIVVAIIAILAAIAIPQFSAYHIKAYNAAAEVNLRNLKTALEAFYADAQQYLSIWLMLMDISAGTFLCRHYDCLPERL